MIELQAILLYVVGATVTFGLLLWDDAKNNLTDPAPAAFVLAMSIFWPVGLPIIIAVIITAGWGNKMYNWYPNLVKWVSKF